MFERFTDVRTLNSLIESGNAAKVKDLIRKGARVDRRAPYLAQDTPLDVAVRKRHTDVVDALLKAGAPIEHSSITLAIEADEAETLGMFAAALPDYHRAFRLTGYDASLNALEYAESLGKPHAVAELQAQGLSSKKRRMKHRDGCIAFLVHHEEFVNVRGVNVDGMAEVTEGYYCANCKRFV